MGIILMSFRLPPDRRDEEFPRNARDGVERAFFFGTNDGASKVVGVGVDVGVSSFQWLVRIPIRYNTIQHDPIRSNTMHCRLVSSRAV